MKPLKQIYYVLLSLLGVLFLPYIGAWIKYDGNFPSDYFNFPALSAPEKAGFSVLAFCAAAAIFLAVIVLYVFPRVYGFKKVEFKPAKPSTKIPFPIWFWVGLVVWGLTLFVLWAKFQEPKWLLNWAYIPLFWGFTLMLDGWVYFRAHRNSLLSRSPHEIIGIGAAATVGWLLFEYLNFFVDDNWFYPCADIVPEDEFGVYAIIGASGLMPAVFEIYNLMNTFPAFRHRYDRGPKLATSRRTRNIILMLALVGIFSISFFPEVMFGVLWIAPLIIFAVVLENFGIWTPFTPIKYGNWSPFLKYSLCYVIYGFLLECWNYFNAIHDPLDPANMTTYTPAHWVYSIPYISRFHVFEMPLVGYLGYLPFGAYCAVWWIMCAFMLNIPTQFAHDEYAEVRAEPLEIPTN